MDSFSPISEVISDFRNGKLVIIVDDADRENEGDLAVAAELVTAEQINFMLKEARGLVCVSLSQEIAKRLNLPAQVEHNNSPFLTPFTVSVDARSVSGHGVTAKARSETIRRLVCSTSKAEDFYSPGHVFPLVANPAGVLGREGQTEGSYDLARLSGLQHGAVICEVLKPDGTMSRGAELEKFAEKHQIKITSIEEIIRYRLAQEVLVRVVAEQVLVTDFGEFKTLVFENEVDGKEHLALVHGDIDRVEPLVRIHSECLTGDVFTSRRCDCGPQLEQSLKQIVENGSGVVLYLRQEGRGIGLGNKIKAYQLQDHGRDTVEANMELGFKPDERDFNVAAHILLSLGIKKLRVLTNNPEKLKAIERAGLIVTERLSLITKKDTLNEEYLKVKKDKLGHWL